jgi:hypothetical protein
MTQSLQLSGVRSRIVERSSSSRAAEGGVDESEESDLPLAVTARFPASHRSTLCFFAGSVNADRAQMMKVINRHQLPCKVLAF